MLSVLDNVAMAAIGALGGVGAGYLLGFTASIVGLVVGALVVGGLYTHVERKVNKTLEKKS